MKLSFDVLGLRQLQHFHWFWSQVNFPILEPRPYPSWVYVIIFILAGLPSLAVPIFALFKFFQRKCCKQKSYKEHPVDTITAKIEMNGKQKF